MRRTPDKRSVSDLIKHDRETPGDRHRPVDFMSRYELLIESMERPPAAITYSLSRALAELLPDREIIEGSHCAFDLEKYAAEGYCEIEVDHDIHGRIVTDYEGLGEPLSRRATDIRYHVEWNDEELDVVLLTLSEGYCSKTYFWIAAERRDLAENFFKAVCDWNSEVRDEILVFEGGYWSKQPELRKGIQGASFENLVLRGDLKNRIHEDLQSFLEAKETYERYRIPWKRGILFVGPPGNGKTHAVKAIINALRIPCLYVKSFQACDEPDTNQIRAVFRRARETAPCLVVFEDLDSLINDLNRSFFLNELDGFAGNNGLITLATTNHPEKLDPAIVDRPSRFDRKYHFDLPAKEEREAFVRLWNENLGEARLREEEPSRVAEATEGFTFAYLKELFLSTLMAWINEGRPEDFAKVMLSEAERLRDQMKRSS